MVGRSIETPFAWRLANFAFIFYNYIAVAFVSQTSSSTGFVQKIILYRRNLCIRSRFKQSSTFAFILSTIPAYFCTMIGSRLFSRSREDEINSALLKQPVDLESLRKLSREKGGFINNRIRTRVWPKLLNVNRYTISDYRSYIDPHRDDSQVRCDVDRSLWNFTHIKTWKESFRDTRRKALSDIIMAILCRNKTLYYYQVF